MVHPFVGQRRRICMATAIWMIHYFWVTASCRKLITVPYSLNFFLGTRPPWLLEQHGIAYKPLLLVCQTGFFFWLLFWNCDRTLFFSTFSLFLPGMETYALCCIMKDFVNLQSTILYLWIFI